MISHQNEHVSTAQRRQHDGLRNLPRLVNHAVVEPSLREKRVVDAQARAPNNPRQERKGGYSTTRREAAVWSQREDGRRKAWKKISQQYIHFVCCKEDAYAASAWARV